MQIEAYFQSIRRDIEACAIILLSNITYDKRGAHEGFLRGELIFSDDSILHLREFVDVTSGIDRLMYAYQYMDADGCLIFRYDNSEHHHELNLPIGRLHTPYQHRIAISNTNLCCFQ